MGKFYVVKFLVNALTFFLIFSCIEYNFVFYLSINLFNIVSLFTITFVLYLSRLGFNISFVIIVKKLEIVLFILNIFYLELVRTRKFTIQKVLFRERSRWRKLFAIEKVRFRESSRQKKSDIEKFRGKEMFEARTKIIDN